LTDVHMHTPLAEAEPASSSIGSFREGPGLVEIGTPVVLFLRRWLVRPLSVWETQLESEAWVPWKASVAVRFAAFCWYLAGALFIALMFGCGFFLGARLL
jgi:hypothetical protein